MNIILRQLMKVATIMGYKWETYPTDTSNKGNRMTETDMIVNTFRDYLRLLSSSVRNASESKQRDIFARARTVRQIARSAGMLPRLDRAIAHDKTTSAVFVNSDFNWTKYANA